MDLFGAQLMNHGGSLVPTSEALAGAEHVAIYFSASWCPPCRGFTPRLDEWVKTHADKLKLKVVFCTADKDEKAFTEYFEGHQQNLHYAIPWADKAVRDALDAKFEVEGIPTLIVVDAKGALVCADARDGVVSEPEGFPWKPKTVWELLDGVQGGKLVNAAGETVPVASLHEKDYVGLYFSAHWCPPCRGFTPKLAEWYKALKARADAPSFELVFVSSDHSKAEFEGYMKEAHPWWALPFEDRAAKNGLSKLFQVRGIPSFVIVAKDGSVAVKEGRSKVMGDLSAAAFPYPPQLVDTLDDAASDYINDQPTLVAFTDKLTDAAAEVAVKEALVAAATALKGQPIRFAIATEDQDSVDQVRTFLGLSRDKDGAQAVRVVVIDIKKQRKALLGNGTGVPTGEQLQEFAAAYLADKAPTVRVNEAPK